MTVTSSITSSRTAQKKWRLPLYAVLAAWIVFFPLVVHPSGTDILYIFAVVPGLSIAGICALIYAAVRRNVSIAVFVMTFFIVLGSLLAFEVKRPVEIRSALRWRLWPAEYKAQVLAQPASPDGDFKHIEWDEWGFGPVADTTLYLVFDPADSLAAELKEHRSGKFSGIPCEVPRVRRLESHWYTVLF